jgi:hypothetical protein
LVLNENTTIQRYQTKIHEGVVPSNLTKYGKCTTVNDGLIYILDKESKRKKLNTPVKENFCKVHLPYLVKLDGTTPSCIFYLISLYSCVFV